MKTSEQTLGALVIRHPEAAKFFHQHGLDFCCGGKQSLAQACAARGLDPEAVLLELETTVPEQLDTVRWELRPIAELVAHILARYHAPLRGELTRLVELSGKVERVHAAKPDCPAGLTDLLEEVRSSVGSHLEEEERILFPMILAGRGALAHMPIEVMQMEHQDHGRNLARIRSLTCDLHIPAHACASWRELYSSLSRLEVELMEHIHLENNILFPRVINA